jgi:hypothetical protein
MLAGFSGAWAAAIVSADQKKCYKSVSSGKVTALHNSFWDSLRLGYTFVSNANR